MPLYTLISTFEVDAPTLEEAYRRYRSAITAPFPDIGYETSDKWFVDGRRGNAAELNAAIDAVLRQEDED